MRLSTLNRGGGLFSRAAITGNKTIAEGDLNSFFTVTSAAMITLPKPQDIKAKLGESLLLMSMTNSAVSVALSAGATIDNYTGPIPLVKGLPMDLIVTSGTSWAIRGVQAASDAEITSGTEQSKFLNSLEHAEHHLKDIPGYNYILNGNFNVWQRATSQVGSSYMSVDRFTLDHNVTTKIASSQAFALGQTDVPGNPLYYMRHIVSSVASAAGYCSMSHRIESVETLAGKKATLSFYAKADAPKNIAIEFAQSFGSGGTPSSSVFGIGVQKIALSTAWQRFVVTVDIPSVAGKVLGTNDSDYLTVVFWFDAGTNFSARCATLGQQSGTFDIACVSLVEGDKDVKPIVRRHGEELALCQRYYQRGYPDIRFHATVAGEIQTSTITLFGKMRAVPTAQLVSTSNTFNVQSSTVALLGDALARLSVTTTTIGDCYRVDTYGFDAEL